MTTPRPRFAPRTRAYARPRTVSRLRALARAGARVEPRVEAPAPAEVPTSAATAAPTPAEAGATTGAGARTAPRTGAPVPTPARSRRRSATAGVLAAALAAGVAVVLAPAARAVDLPHTPLDRQLTVTYDDGNGHIRAYTVACGIPYDVSDGGAACRQLAQIGGPVGPVPPGQMCSMLYGGPQTARVTGMWDGRPVDETYRRTNGCEVARWNRMSPLLPSTGPGLMHPLVG